MYYIGVDIGGMSMKSGIVDENGVIISSSVIPTDKVKYKTHVKKLSRDILNLIKNSSIDITQIKGIGVGCPGAISPSDGSVHFSNNLGWTDVNLKKDLEELTGLNVRIANDADSATLGELIFGVAKNYKNVVMITLGTGVGGGVIINKKLYEGSLGVVSELGHITLRSGGLQCSCGRRGCYEQYASVTALIRQTKESMKKHKTSKMWNYCDGDIEKVNGKTAFLASKAGDKYARNVVEKYINYIAEGLLDVCNVFRPDAIVLGGAISKEGRYLTDKIVKYLDIRDYGYPGAPRSEILVAKLGNDAGIVGAAALVAEEDFS